MTKCDAPQWVHEFGEDYAVPDEITQLEGIEDTSWHNDAAASFGLYGEAPDGQMHHLVIWVSHPDPERREYPENGRYAVSRHCDNGDLWTEHYDGDDAAEAVRAFMEALPEYWRLVRG